MDGEAPTIAAERSAGQHATERTIGFDRPVHGPSFWIGLVLGGAVMTYAVWGMVHDFGADERVDLATWLLGSALAHDLLLAPIVTVVGLLLARILPRSIRGPVLGALALSGMVVLFSWSSLRGFGRREVNPSILPHDYGRNVAVVLAIVWTAAAALVVIRLVRERTR